MSYFKSNLKVELVSQDDDDIPTWKLIEPLRYSSDILNRTVEVPAGYETDFASVPRAPIAYFIAGNTGHRAAVLHDYLITSKEVERKIADSIFAEALSATGVDSWRKQVMYLAVSQYTNILEGKTDYDPQQLP
jgi:hypothetical protein